MRAARSNPRRVRHSTLSPRRAVWWLNLLCFLVHTIMVFVTFNYAYWQHKHPNGDRFDLRYDTEHMMVRIYRFTGIPTQAMIDNNETVWNVDEWRNGTFGKTEFYLRDNDLPVNYASLVASFFAISAVFHLCAPFRLTVTQTITLTTPLM